MDHKPSPDGPRASGQVQSHRHKHGWFFPDKSRIHPDDLDVVPTDFRWDQLTNTYDITWGYVGDLDHRYVFFDEFAERLAYRGRLLSPGEEIPAGVACVVTKLVPPLVYPEDCPRFDRHLLATPEPTGGLWLKGGRVALMAGVRKGTIPRNCTRKPFPITRLGLDPADRFHS